MLLEAECIFISNGITRIIYLTKIRTEYFVPFVSFQFHSPPPNIGSVVPRHSWGRVESHLLAFYSSPEPKVAANSRRTYQSNRGNPADWTSCRSLRFQKSSSNVGLDLQSGEELCTLFWKKFKCNPGQFNILIFGFTQLHIFHKIKAGKFLWFPNITT